jgi:F-type H+/Na+-transporting ATPase subunit alpha
MAGASNNIYDALLKQIQDFSPTIESVEVGYVKEVGDGIARVSGIANVRMSELVRFSTGVVGIAFNLEEDTVGVIILGEYEHIQESTRYVPEDGLRRLPECARTHRG